MQFPAWLGIGGMKPLKNGAALGGIHYQVGVAQIAPRVGYRFVILDGVEVYNLSPCTRNNPYT